MSGTCLRNTTQAIGSGRVSFRYKRIRISRNMSLAGTIVGIQEIKSDAAKFFDVFAQKTHHISNLTHHINECRIHEGDHGVVGSIIHWDYVRDGKDRDLRHVIKAIDDEKHSITLEVVEGDVLKEYKTFTKTLQATNKEDGPGAIVSWTMKYEKVNASVPPPTRYLDIGMHMIEGIDQHIQEEEASA